MQDNSVKLSNLARCAVAIDRYRPETCCIVGNYYSLLGVCNVHTEKCDVSVFIAIGSPQNHAKAIVYFQRALKLDPNYLSAWTLMGHELVELKNTNAYALSL